jgi:hypothetical protein
LTGVLKFALILKNGIELFQNFVEHIRFMDAVFDTGAEKFGLYFRL